VNELTPRRTGAHLKKLDHFLLAPCFSRAAFDHDFAQGLWPDDSDSKRAKHDSVTASNPEEKK